MKRYYKMQCQDTIGTSEQLKLGVTQWLTKIWKKNATI
jgi:hypothetical protein